MLKLVVVVAIGACLLLVSAVWSGTVIQNRLNQFETFSGPELGAAQLVP